MAETQEQKSARQAKRRALIASGLGFVSGWLPKPRAEQIQEEIDRHAEQVKAAGKGEGE